MDVKIDILTKQFFAGLDGYARHMEIEPKKAMRRQFRILLMRIMSWTPPFNKRPSNRGDALAAGNNSVMQDLKKIAMITKAGVIDFWQYSIGGGDYISKQTFKKAGSQEEYTIEDAVIDRGGSQLKSLNARARAGRRQRVPRRYSGRRAIIDQGAFDKTVEQVQSSVGKAKAGWLETMLRLGHKPQPWITRHGTGSGRYYEIQTGDFVELSAVNTAKSIGSLGPSVVASSIRAQTRAMVREMESASKSAAKRARILKDHG